MDELTKKGELLTISTQAYNNLGYASSGGIVMHFYDDLSVVNVENGSVEKNGDFTLARISFRDWPAGKKHEARW